MSYCVRRWKHGSYTLLHDNDIEQGQECALDVFMHFNAEGTLVRCVYLPVYRCDQPAVVDEPVRYP